MVRSATVRHRLTLQCMVRAGRESQRKRVSSLLSEASKKDSGTAFLFHFAVKETQLCRGFHWKQLP